MVHLTSCRTIWGNLNETSSTNCCLACVASVPVWSERNSGSAISLSHSGRAKNGARTKRLKEGGGGGERRERLPANPSILKNPFAHERGSWLVRRGHLDWQVYQVRLNDSSNNSCVTRICHKRKLFSCCFNYLSYAKIQQDPADFDSLIWQPRLALLSHFSCSDNERPNLRSRRMYSRWQFSNKGFRFPVGSIIQRLIFLAPREWSDRQANERSELYHRKS